MKFIDLHRFFVPISKEKDTALDWEPDSGQKYGGWLNWSNLLQHRRVALLAEALSGKTQELEFRARQIKEQGLPAFFVRIEDLADRGFESALQESDLEVFRTWKTSGSGDAWFFLDSVDEARLNGKRFSSALRGFCLELGRANLNRSFVIVSCRASDWKGKSDRETLQNELPFDDVEAAPPPEPNADEILLSGVFNIERREPVDPIKSPTVRSGDLTVVQLVPLTNDQKALMAKAAGIDAEAFLQAINLSGLNAMAERPGDLIELIGYWSEHQHFGSLRDMTEEGVCRKLREEDVYRGAAGVLSPETARKGAERLAGALVFGKTFSLKAPGQEPDPTLSRGAIDPTVVLNDWGQNDVNALLRTGIFAPSTYGRVKFHHRATQEYLTASWLRSLLEANCPSLEVQQILFAEPYGVKTAVPALLAVSAWLSQWVPWVRDELIKREPAALIIHGDPKSLSLSVRETLLVSYARLDAAGQLDSENIDYRAAWMFSDPALATAVKRAWDINSRPDFRMHLLQFVEEGRIKGRVDLARQIGLDSSQDQYARLLAARALVACEDDTGLRKLARQVRSAPDRFGARLAPQLAEQLYPKYLNTDDLLQLVERSQQAQAFSSEGFAPRLASLHARASSRADQRQLTAGVADLVLAPAHMEEGEETSSRFVELFNGIAELARAELSQCSLGEVDAGTLRLLMAVERAGHAHGDAEAMKALLTRIRSDKTLNRALMWADARTSLKGGAKDEPPVHVFQIGPHTGRALWATDQSDLDWLIQDVRDRPHANERRIAFSAVYLALQGQELLPDQRALLDDLASQDESLATDLTAFLEPRKSDKWEVDRIDRQLKKQQTREATKQAWLDFRNTLRDAPEILDRPGAVSSWKSGLFRLYELTEWLKRSAAQKGSGSIRTELLCAAFGPRVAEHYESAMRQAWRCIAPARPVIARDGSYSVMRTNLLAVDALNLESLNPGWPDELNDSDAQLAIRHATMAGTVRADWVDRLIRSKTLIVLPEIVKAIRQEFKSGGRFSDILVHAAHDETAARSQITFEVFKLLKAKEPTDKQTLHYCLRILTRGLDTLSAKEVNALIRKRLAGHRASGNEDRVISYLGLLASSDGERLAKEVLAELVRGANETEPEFGERVTRWLGTLFDRYGSGGSALASLRNMKVESLVELIRIAYRYVQPREDRKPGADSTRNNRDLAEGARSALLNALIGRPGADAYSVLATLARDPDFADYSMRFRELAHRKAQTDADIVPWNAKEVYEFGRLYSAPVKTGMQLLRLALTVLSDISTSLQNADASSRAVLARAEDEEEVQNWLTERLNERRRGRYHAHREAEVADRNEPDIILSSASADIQVAIEIKNANMGWTVSQLERAISGQLAGDYLRTENRRHGILVVSLHRQKFWRVSGEKWDFDRLINHLQSFASGVTSNSTGGVEVRVVGINAYRPPPICQKPKNGP